MTLAAEPPEVSVVIPLYNGASYVADTISSVRAQVLDSLELLVVDDGSVDASVDVARSSTDGDPRCRIMTFPNGGLAAARQRGLAEARGRFISFLDQDDLWYPSFLLRLVDSMADARVAAVGCLMDYINDEGRRLGRSAQTPRVIDQSQVRRGEIVPFPPSAILFRTAFVRSTGAAEDLFGRGLATGADLSLIARTATAGDVMCVREALCARRVHRTSTMAQAHMEQFAAVAYTQAVIQDPTFADRTSWPSFRNSYRPNRHIIRYQRAIVEYREGALNLIDRRWLSALRCFAAALWHRPDYTLRRAWAQARGQ